MVFSGMKTIDATTELYGVIGHPVGHSLGPAMHNRAFAATGYPGVYLAFDVTDIASAVSGIRGFHIGGISVTIPHKVAVMDYLDAVDETAGQIGAVNTVVNRDGRLTGFNTDAYGAVAALSEKMDPEGRDVAVIGAGGAARAVAHGIGKKRGRVCIVNRNREKGRKLAEECNAAFLPYDEIGALSCDILINTTPLGMAPNPETIPVPEDILHPGMTVMDIVYNPVKTRLLECAEAAGCKTIDGVGMFVYQGARQFELWTGRTAPVDVMREVVYESLAARGH